MKPEPPELLLLLLLLPPPYPRPAVPLLLPESRFLHESEEYDEPRSRSRSYVDEDKEDDAAA